jgi:hypothetical protein
VKITGEFPSFLVPFLTVGCESSSYAF